MTTHGPLRLTITVLGSRESVLTRTFLSARTISVTSSLTPLSEQNSWGAPAIFTLEMAQPSMDESSTRRSELPIVRA